MSKIEVDEIVPRTGNNLTVGSSGQTIIIPSGATFNASNSTFTLPDGSVVAAKIATGAITADKIASSIDLSSKTVTLPSAAVTAHVTQFDDASLKDGIAMLAFKLASTSSLAKFTLKDQIIDEFTDNTGIDTGNSTNINLATGLYKGVSSSVAYATGGTITDETIDGVDYKVHTFTSSGTFTAPSSGTLANVYIIGGGGGGGAGGTGGFYGMGGGGGSSGGMTTLSSHSVTAQGYSITVGGGGSGSTSPGGGCDASGGSGSGGSSSSAFGSSASGGNSGAGGRDPGGGGGSAPSGGNSGESGVQSPLGGCTSTTPARGGHGGHSPYDNTGRGTRGEGGCAVAGSAGSQYGAGGGGGQGGKCCGGGTGSGCSGGNGGNGAAGAVVIKYAASAFTTETAGANITLISTANTAASAPTNADLTILYNDNAGTATLNTDLIGHVSRDGGTTYTTVTLTAEGTSSNYKIATAHDVDISSQPSGTSMKWKITTANQSESTKETEIAAVSLGWS